MIESNEQVLVVSRQSKYMPGGKMVTPKTLFATNRRILIRDPKALGLKSKVNSIPYSQINNVKLEKGAFTSKLIIESGNFDVDDEGFVDAIPKNKADKIIGIINQYLRPAQNHYMEQSQPRSEKNEDSLVILKQRLARGEITKDEYNDLKPALE